MTAHISTTDRMRPAYCLRYVWTGWPSRGPFCATPMWILDELRPTWESDGMRLLEAHWTHDRIQLLYSTRPHVDPISVARLAKGRLAHALANSNLPMPFSRKLAVRSVGHNSRHDVESYIRAQVPRGQFADPRFRTRLDSFTVVNDKVNLATPVATTRGRFWYNLHLVLVTEGRLPARDARWFAMIRDTMLQVGADNGFAVSRLAVMPDHLHIAVRGTPERSPDDIAGAFLACPSGRGRVWRDGYYVGTFGEYTMGAIRRRVGAAVGSSSPTRQARGGRAGDACVN